MEPNGAVEVGAVAGKLGEVLGGGIAAIGDGDDDIAGTGAGAAADELVGRTATRAAAPNTGQAEEDKPTENDELVGVDTDRVKAGTERGGNDAEATGTNDGEGVGGDEAVEEGEDEEDDGDADAGTPPTSIETGCRSSHCRSSSDKIHPLNSNYTKSRLMIHQTGIQQSRERWSGSMRSAQSRLLL
jgi:hypothetical protein